MTAPPQDAGLLAAELQRAWRRSDALFEMLSPEALMTRPLSLRHPFIFYLGHLPAFASNQISGGVLGRSSETPELDALFERGIDPLDETSADAATISAWPAVEQVIAYRDRVRADVLQSFEAVAARAPDDILARGWRIHHLVLEHELMHHETLLYMVQAADHGLKRRPVDLPRPPLGAGPLPERIRIPAGRVTLGVALDDVPFAWDNELGHAVVEVEAFEVDHVPVTVGRFAEFVQAGGYSDHRHWSRAGWAWRQRANLQHPTSWRRGPEGGFEVASLFEHLPLEAVSGWPVQVSHAEAHAFAHWRGARLPTEPELHRAAYGTPDGHERLWPWGDEPPDGRHGAFGWQVHSPVPVGSHPRGASAFGVEELVGNGWEWTDTPFAPLPGFTAWARTYPGYSTDFFDGAHKVVFGAAWPTDKRLMRRAFRNWYQGMYPHPFSAFRCVY